MSQQFTQQALTWFKKITDSLTDPGSGSTFHYTTVHNAYEIISTGEFFASHLECLDDTQEVCYRKGIINESCDKAKEKLGSNYKQTSQYLDDIRVHITEAPGEVGSYVACFSGHRDEISQWAGYGGFGKGVALGFSRTQFANLQPMGSAYTIWGTPVIYKRDAQLRRLGKVWRSIIREFQKPVNPDDYGVLLPLAITIAASALKGRNWSDENEMRLVVALKVGRLPSVRKSSHGLSVYVPVGLGSKKRNCRIPSLRKIVIGPRADFESLRFAFEKLLIAKGYGKSQVKITQSNVKLRR